MTKRKRSPTMMKLRQIPMIIKKKTLCMTHAIILADSSFINLKPKPRITLKYFYKTVNKKPKRKILKR